MGVGSTNSAGAQLAAGKEYEDLLFKIGSSAAAAVYGKLGIDFLGSSATLDATSGLPSPASALPTFETVWGSGNVDPKSVNKGYRLKFIGTLDGYDIPAPTPTPSTTYLLNDGTAIPQPSKFSQQDYRSPVAAVKEKFTVSAQMVQLPGTAAFGNGVVSGTVNFSITFTVDAVTAPLGFTLVAGGISSAFATFEQDTAADVPDFAITSDIGSGQVPADIATDAQGAVAVTEQFGQVVVSWQGSTVGWIGYTDVFTTAIPTNADNAAALTILNDPAAYNGNVDTAVMNSAVATLTITFVSGQSPGSVTIGGKVGTAVTASLVTVQNGLLLYPPPVGRWPIEDGNVFTDTPGTIPALDTQAIREIGNEGTGGSAATSASDSARGIRDGNKVTCDGVDDSYACNIDIAGTDSFTFSAFYTPNELGRRQAIIGRGQDTSGGWSVNVDQDVSDKFQCRLVLTGPGSTSVPTVTSTTSAVIGTECHVCAVWDSGVNLKLYVNGVLEDTAADTNTALRSSAIGLRIADGDGAGGLFPNGKIKSPDARNVAFSALKVAALAAGSV